MTGKGCACSVQVQAFSLKYSIQLAEMQNLPLDTGLLCTGGGCRTPAELAMGGCLLELVHGLPSSALLCMLEPFPCIPAC